MNTDTFVLYKEYYHKKLDVKYLNVFSCSEHAKNDLLLPPCRAKVCCSDTSAYGYGRLWSTRSASEHSTGAEPAQIDSHEWLPSACEVPTVRLGAWLALVGAIISLSQRWFSVPRYCQFLASLQSVSSSQSFHFTPSLIFTMYSSIPTKAVASFWPFAWGSSPNNMPKLVVVATEWC